MTTPRPTAPQVAFEAIPFSLKQVPRWVLWKYVWRESAAGAKWTKLPVRLNGKAASATDPSTWATFDQVRRAYGVNTRGCDGVGLVFTTEDDLVGVDLDDCLTVDPLTDEPSLSAMAEDLLASVDGYAEVSPSGEGLKLWCRAGGMPRAFAEKSLGLEFYPHGRFFTVTGHAVPSHGSLPLESDQGEPLRAWLARWLPDGDARAKARTTPAPGGDGVEEADLDAVSAPVEGWDLERVVAELLSKFDPDCGYSDWLKVGMAVHHQTGGSLEGLEAWDEWSQRSDAKYTEGLCEEKWDSFAEEHSGGVVTLRSLLKDLPASAVATSASRVAAAVLKINQVATGAELEGPISKKLREQDLSDLEREQLAMAIQRRIREIDGTKISIGTVRGWLTPRRAWVPFPDTNADGAPLGTHANVAEVLSRLSAVVRYNVISKEDEILIPGEAYTIDNAANAALARVISECAKFEVPIGQVKGYVTLLADLNQFNPALAWIESAPWDGQDRLPELAATLDVEPGQRALRDLLLRRWLLTAVALLHNTGSTQGRGILTLQGGESKGKSRWLLSLAPPDSRLAKIGHVLDVHRVDSVKQALACWLLELGEVDGTFKKSDLPSLKAWASQQVDTLRKPYAHAEGSYPRRTALFASLNKHEFLQGDEGNTRFWTLGVLAVDHQHKVNMQQLWAQVLVLWQGGERHWLDEAEGALLDASNRDFVIADPVDEVIRNRFDWAADQSSGGQWLTATEVLQQVGMTRVTRADLVTCAATVRRLNGGRQKRSTDKAARRLVWVPALRGSADSDFDDEAYALL